MTTDEVIDLLTFMASFDRRTVGQADVAAWKLAVGDLPFADAQEAVLAHYRESRDWAMPVDIRDRVKAMRGERLKSVPMSDPPDEVADDPAAYQAWLLAERKRIADGPAALRALGQS